MASRREETGQSRAQTEMASTDSAQDAPQLERHWLKETELNRTGFRGNKKETVFDTQCLSLI